MMIKCKVCGCEFTPVIDKHYVARDNGESGFTNLIRNQEGNLYDAFDCPACGCQLITQERKRDYYKTLNVAETEDDEDESED